MSDAGTLKAIFVDFDGVLRHWPDTTSALEQAFGMEQGAIHSTAFSSELLEPAIRGRHTDAEWRHQIAVQLSKAFPGINTHSVVSEWAKHCGHINDPLLRLLKKHHPKVPLILASNATTRLPLDLNALGITDIFDFVINSSSIGKIKPERAFFQSALDTVGVDANQCIFIDDSLCNVNQARAMGMLTHRFSNNSNAESFLR